MISILFIAQSNHMSRFESIFASDDIFASVCNAERIPSLTSFLAREKTIAQQDYLMLDVGDCTCWSQSHIISAIQQLSRFSRAKPILFGQPCDAQTDLYGKLASVHGLDALLVDGDNVDDKLRRILSGNNDIFSRLGVMQNYMERQTRKVLTPLHIPQQTVIRVAVSGSMPRCGATTQAIALYHYLRSLGAQVAIRQEDNELLADMRKYERDRISIHADGSVDIDGIVFAPEQKSEDFNAIVTDVGLLSPDNAEAFCAADLPVIVGGIKPWEIGSLAAAVSQAVPYHNPRLLTLISFSPATATNQLSHFFGSHTAVVPYMPDIWTAGKTAEQQAVYADTALPLLREICGDTPEIDNELEVG